MKPMLIVVPSLGRPHNAVSFIEAWQRTTSGKSDLLFVLEDNDPTFDQYPQVDGVWYLVGHYRCSGNAFNAAFRAYPDYEFYAPLNDDHWVRTEGWEDTMIAALADGGIVYGNDGFQGERLATAPVLDGDMVRALGWISPPGMKHLYIDDAWMVIGRALGRLTYLPDVLFEHMHPEAAKGQWDETYKIANSAEAYARDRADFNEWLERHAEADIARAQGVVA